MVLAAAQRYILPDHYVMVVAGAEGSSAPAAGDVPREVLPESDESAAELPEVPSEEQTPKVASTPEPVAPESIPTIDQNDNPENQ